MIPTEKERFVSIKTKMIVLFLLVIILPILVMSYSSYLSSQKLLERKYTDLLQEISRQANIRIDEYLTEVEKISMLASYGVNSYVSYSAQDNYPIQNFLRDSSKENESQAYRLLMNYIMMKDRAFSVYIYNLNGGRDLYISSNKPVNYNYTSVQEPWFQQFLQSSQSVFYLQTHQDYQTKSDNNWAISNVRKIFDMKDGKLLGVMVVSIDIDFIDKVNGRLLESRRSAFTILDENENIIYNSDYETIGKPFAEVFPVNLNDIDGVSGGGITHVGDKDYIVTYLPFERRNWKTVLYMPLNELSVEGDILRRNLLMIAFLLILFAVVSSFYISARITRPLKILMRNMTSVERGVFENLPTVKSNDEIGLLANRFHLMSHELKQLVNRIYVEEKEKAEAEMRALQAQINPHFLYNTLNSVKWIASMQRSDKIVEMTEALISMLRYTTNKTGTLVSICDELENIKHYVTIQKIRYYNRIQVDFDVDENVLDCKILKLTIQPIVENAIFHGTSEHEDEGKIRIAVYVEDGTVVISVSDNGAGMDEATIRNLNQGLANPKGTFNGIGISNVNSRIKNHFGSSYGIRFTSSLGNGTTFYIKIPAIFDRSDTEVSTA
ncbi:cache domain-containing sensor histidine kinase [Paenibacillus alkalitolerans]|uniref:cache domain-containing sensor histidine kinase n=1 Tax=Paenibacillus alkalitolerans TaxID=2799335 RepID=UPI0018F60071|nr:sensor histidine kinase [Paenibacillus alkalitolerans]